MAGEFTVISKPSRSDEVLDASQQLNIANQVRHHFDSIAPKRPIKPNRSDPESGPIQGTPGPGNDVVIPELEKLRCLKSESHFSAKEESMVQDEFRETHYYKELGSIDKLHHTTGTGFIKVVGNEGRRYDLRLQNGVTGTIYNSKGCKFRSNPATNDWIPTYDQVVYHVSTKPNRSETN